MSAWLLGLALAQAGASSQPAAKIFEFPDVHAHAISVQVVIKTGALDEHDLAIAKLIADTVTIATLDFNDLRMREFTLQTGRQFRCTLLPDCLRFDLEMPANQLKLGASIVAGELINPRFSEESIKDDLSRIPFRARSFWAEALFPYKLKFDKLQRGDIEPLFEKLFRPENTTIAVSGPFAKSEASIELLDDLKDWRPAKIYHPTYKVHPAPPLEKHSSGVTTFDFSGPEFPATDEAFAKNLLAAIALGTGKGSTLFKVIRNKEGWSYRQEAMLYPTPEGMQVRMIVARAAADGEGELGEKMRADIAADVKAWTEADRKRAAELAEMVLVRSLPISPLYISNEYPLGDNLSDRTFLEGYWQMKTGHAWNPVGILQMVDSVSLDDLRATAADIVSKSTLTMIPGSR